MKSIRKNYYKLGIGFVFLVIVVFVWFTMRGHLEVPPVLVVFGVLPIRLYGLFIGFAVIIGSYLIEETLKKSDIYIGNLLFWVFVPGIIGARLWHVLSDFHLYENNLVGALHIWNGGGSIFGAMLGGTLGAYVYLKRHSQPFLKTLEAISLYLPIGQIIGRFGNLVNQELFGPPTNLFWGMYVREGNRPDRFVEFSYFHPAFLYEIIGNIFLFCILRWLYNRKGLRGDGLIVAVYLMGYGGIRFFVDFFRLDRDIFLFLSLGQIVSLIMVSIGGGYFLYLKFRNKKREC